MPALPRDPQRTVRISLFIIFIIAMLVLLIKLFPVIFPFFLGVLFAYLLRPAVNRIMLLGVRAGTAVIVLYLYIALGCYLFVVCMAPIVAEQIRNLLIYLPQLLSELQSRAGGFLSVIQHVQLPESLSTAISDGLAAWQEKVSIYVQNGAAQLGALIKIAAYLALMPILSFYMLRDKHLTAKILLSWLPAQERPELQRLARDVDHLLRQFVMGYLLVSVIVVVMSAIFFYCVGIKYPLALGLLMGVADLIPYFGPFIGAIPAVIVALGDSTQLAVITVIGIVVLQQLEGSVITPKIMGNKIGLHPLTTIFAVLAGGYLFGLLGTVLAVPAIAALLLIGKYIFGRLVGIKTE